MNILTCKIRFVFADVIASSVVLRAFDVSLFEFTVSRMNHVMLPIDKMQSIALVKGFGAFDRS